MSEDKVDADVAVPAMPDREPIKPDQTLEDGKSGEQNNLNEGEVRPEQSGQPPDACQQVAS